MLACPLRLLIIMLRSCLLMRRRAGCSGHPRWVKQRPPAPPRPLCRHIAAEVARRLLELAGWLAGRVPHRGRLRGFERAYFPLRRWHVALGECQSLWALGDVRAL